MIQMRAHTEAFATPNTFDRRLRQRSLRPCFFPSPPVRAWAAMSSMLLEPLTVINMDRYRSQLTSTCVRNAPALSKFDSTLAQVYTSIESKESPVL